jgi:prevent-host-death family protein
VVPISKAASSLAALIKRSRTKHQPIIVTQKGYPAGVIVDIELFTALRQLADRDLREFAGDISTQEA